jgi:hypothetical protein
MIEELTTIMPDNETRKRFGLRIKELRKQKKMDTKRVGGKIGCTFPVAKQI